MHVLFADPCASGGPLAGRPGIGPGYLMGGAALPEYDGQGQIHFPRYGVVEIDAGTVQEEWAVFTFALTVDRPELAGRAPLIRVLTPDSSAVLVELRLSAGGRLELASVGGGTTFLVRPEAIRQGVEERIGVAVNAHDFGQLDIAFCYGGQWFGAWYELAPGGVAVGKFTIEAATWEGRVRDLLVFQDPDLFANEPWAEFRVQSDAPTAEVEPAGWEIRGEGTTLAVEQDEGEGWTRPDGLVTSMSWETPTGSPAADMRFSDLPEGVIAKAVGVFVDAAVIGDPAGYGLAARWGDEANLAAEYFPSIGPAFQQCVQWRFVAPDGGSWLASWGDAGYFAGVVVQD